MSFLVSAEVEHWALVKIVFEVFQMPLQKYLLCTLSIYNSNSKPMDMTSKMKSNWLKKWSNLLYLKSLVVHHLFKRKHQLLHIMTYVLSVDRPYLHVKKVVLSVMVVDTLSVKT